MLSRRTVAGLVRLVVAFGSWFLVPGPRSPARKLTFVPQARDMIVADTLDTMRACWRSLSNVMLLEVRYRAVHATQGIWWARRRESGQGCVYCTRPAINTLALRKKGNVKRSVLGKGGGRLKRLGNGLHRADSEKSVESTSADVFGSLSWKPPKHQVGRTTYACLSEVISPHSSNPWLYPAASGVRRVGGQRVSCSSPSATKLTGTGSLILHVS